MATKKQKAYSKKRGLNKRRKTMKGGFGWEDLKRAIGLSSATSTTYDATKQPDNNTTEIKSDEVKPIDNDTGTTGDVASEQDGGKKQKKSKSKSKSKSKK